MREWQLENKKMRCEPHRQKLWQSVYP